MSDKTQLRWSDIWLLLSVYFASVRAKPCLREIIAAADYINHAVINFEELSSGLVRLQKAGFILVDDIASSILCSSRSLALIETVVQRTKCVYDARKELERELNVCPWNSKELIPNPSNNLEFPGLTRETYDSAVSEYIRSMKVKR